MSSNKSETADGTAHDSNDLRSRAGSAIQAARSRTRAGTLAIVAGGILLARAFRSKGRLRTAVQGLAGLALVGIGLRRRLSPGGTFETGEEGSPAAGLDEEHLGTPTRTEHAREGVSNPRDVDEEPDVDRRTGPDEGSVGFTDEGGDEPRSKPHVEGDQDPRRDVGDEPEVDVSESAMADEPSEATGPDPEQAEPTQTEDTEPEARPPEDASHVEADADEADASSEDDEAA